MEPVLLLQCASAFVVSSCYSWLAGTALARYWLVGADLAGTAIARRLRSYDLWAAGLASSGIVLVLLAGAAAMSGLPLSEAHQVVLPLFGTDFGRTGIVVLGALLALLGLRWLDSPRAFWGIELALLLAVTLARASMGHAGEAGLFSTAHLSESLHLACIGIWTGIVLVSAGPMLATRSGGGPDGIAHQNYLVRMSDAALVAVLLIIATGVYNTWHRTGGTIGILQGGPYIVALAIKVALVVLALMLGAYNKMVGLPEAARSAHGVHVVRGVLKVEAAVLLLAMLAAAILTVLAPPSAA